jgi:hypothetical protein
MNIQRRQELFDEKLKLARAASGQTDRLFEKYGFTEEEQMEIRRGYKRRTGRQGASGRTDMYKAVLKIFDAHFSIDGLRYDVPSRRRLIVAGFEYARRKNIEKLMVAVREGEFESIVNESKKHMPSIEQIVDRTQDAYNEHMRASAQLGLMHRYVGRY